jgi:ferredoxin
MPSRKPSLKPRMPNVFFEGNLFGDDRSVDVPEGGPLVDVCDAARAPVPFSCRSATCGTCRVEIVEGAELLEPPEPAEEDLLAIFGDPGHFRLACQAKLKPEPGLVRLRIADDEL